MTIKEYGEEYSIPEITDSMGYKRKTTDLKVIFPNGWRVNIIDKAKLPKRYSVAACDWDGFFDWDILKQFGANEYGAYICETEEQVCEMLENVRNLKSIRR